MTRNKVRIDYFRIINKIMQIFFSTWEYVTNYGVQVGNGVYCTTTVQKNTIRMFSQNPYVSLPLIVDVHINSSTPIEDVEQQH